MVLAISLTAALQAASPPTGYQLISSTGVETRTKVVTRHLQVLEDARLTPSVVAAIHQYQPSGAGFPSGFCLEPPDTNETAFKSICSSIRTQPLKSVLLCLTDSAGHTLLTQDIHGYFATLEATHWRPDSVVTFLITIPFTGAQPGTESLPLEITGDSIVFVQAVDTLGGLYGWGLDWSVHSGWHAVPAAHGGQDVLSAVYDPELVQDSLVPRTLLTRFTFTAGRWIMRQRSIAGYWESDQPFPARSRFP